MESHETISPSNAFATLIAYLVLLIVYAVQLTINKGQDPEITKTLSNCLAVDFVFIFISLFGISVIW